MGKAHKISLITLAALTLAGCEVGSSSKATPPFRAATGGTSNVAAESTVAEVGRDLVVSVNVKDKSGFPVSGVIPTITAVSSTGSSSGISSSGCTSSNAKGVSVCNLTSQNAGTFTVKTISPFVTLGTTVRFYQAVRFLKFTTQPTCLNVAKTDATTAGSSCVSTKNMTNVPVVQLVDANQNAVLQANTFDPTVALGTVTLSLTTAGTATLSGTKTSVASGATGIANTFANLKIDKTNSGGTYTLTASYPDPKTGLITKVSDSFPLIADSASKLTFSTDPGPTSPALSVPANTVFGVAPVVSLQDASGNSVTTDSSCVVTMSLTAQIGTGDVLLGTLSKTVSSGVASFASANLRINTIVGGSYTLTASPGSGSSCVGATSATSGSVTVSLAGLPKQLTLTQAPGPSPINKVWDVQPIVQVLDSAGNLVSGDNTTVVVLSKTTGSGSIVGSTSVRVTNGTATFSGVKTSGTVAGAPGSTEVYTLTFSGVNPGAPSISPVSTTQILNNNGQTPSKVAFSAQPANVAKNQPEASAVVVDVQDTHGFFCFNDNSTVVTLTISSGPGSMKQNGTVVASIADTAFNGQASFPALSFTAAGTYILQATAAGLAGSPSQTSSQFAVSNFGTANRVHFIAGTPDDSTVNGKGAWSTQPQVEVLDAFDNRVTSDNSTVVILDCVSPLTTPACTLSGTLSKTMVNGFADFTGANITTSNVSTTQSQVSIRAQTVPSGALLSDQSRTFNEN